MQKERNAEQLRRYYYGTGNFVSGRVLERAFDASGKEAVAATICEPSFWLLQWLKGGSNCSAIERKKPGVN